MLSSNLATRAVVFAALLIVQTSSIASRYSSTRLAFATSPPLMASQAACKCWLPGGGQKSIGTFYRTLPALNPMQMQMGRPADEPIERVRGSGSEGSADEESENTSVLDKYRKILRDADSEAATKDEGNFFAKMMASAKIKACETDFDCNPGGRSWPLRCVDIVVSKICMEVDDSDDSFGGGRMMLAMEPIPVRIEDGYYDDEATTSGGGWSETSW
mmetsp:Transcript_62668/g.91883  ORF Transcript_62668/g.91883 Transcript_62668/m.91883 type:complete len:216 (+) Transcript_62668:148-795(+)